MDTAIEYYFGTGHAPPTHWWTAPDLDLDGDGRLDAVALDFDGDGRSDDAMWDTDGDGVADLAALDLDDDGVRESFYADGGGGLWETAADPPPDTGAVSARPPAETPLDTDGDGRPDTVLLDGDGDGFADAYRRVGYRATGSDSSTGRADPSAR
ncbi:hypothetical protein [Gordonia sihwensis]|uniref:hypothetical protein n=1 Tax=Gordonia TaxID=2053 RepID=UPI0024165367|nr:hypothetical protein [Gordonia sihwensis]WFN92805.1 hypothetical protein P5P27_19025 [Gordonia sihwensis]